jgi:hypothetical protein
MSRKVTGRSADAARLTHPAEYPLPTPARENDRSGGDTIVGESVLATDPRATQPVRPARVGPSRNAHAHSYNDPSNYLG